MKSEKSHFSRSKEKGHSKVNKTLGVASVTIVTVNLQVEHYEEKKAIKNISQSRRLGQQNWNLLS